MIACTDHLSTAPGTLSVLNRWDWVRKEGSASHSHSGFPLQSRAPSFSPTWVSTLDSPWRSHPHSPFSPKLFSNRFRNRKSLDEEEGTSGRDRQEPRQPGQRGEGRAWGRPMVGSENWPGPGMLPQPSSSLQTVREPADKEQAGLGVMRPGSGASFTSSASFSPSLK